MRIARKLFALTVMALAAMALSATSASAVEVSSGGDHCSAVTIEEDHDVHGGCLVEAVSERETQVQVWVDPPGIWATISTCEDHFEAAIGEDGTGYLYNATTSGHTGPPCTRTQCDEAEPSHAKLPWPLELESATEMEIRFCLRTIENPDVEGAPGTECHTYINIEPDNDTGQHEFLADGDDWGLCENLFNLVRVEGHWNVVPSGGHPAITIDP